MLRFFSANRLYKSNLYVPLQPANKESETLFKRRKTKQNLLNKFCEKQKSFYLCSPQTKKRRVVHKRVEGDLRDEGKLHPVSQREAKKASNLFSNKFGRSGKDFYLCSPKTTGL
jgi:hypothetical protein